MKLRKKIAIIFNSIYWNLKKNIVKGHLNISFLQLLSKDTHIKITEKGFISINKFCRTRRCVDILAFNGGKIIIGDSCFFNKNCSITACELIKIGNNVSVGNNVVIVDHDHNFRKNGTDDKMYISEAVVIEDDVWIGANTVVLRGSTIGKGAVIAAGSIVKGVVQPHEIFVQRREKIGGSVIKQDEKESRT